MLTANRTPRLRRALDAAAENHLLVVLVCALAGLLVIIAPQLFVSDSWMTLVAGREIVQHGLPSDETLTTMALGRRWTDQQWLAQLVFYGAEQLAGLRLVALIHVACVAAAFGSALAFARLRGATTRSTLLVAVVAFIVAPWSWQLRAQSLALPLFVWTLGLVGTDRRLAHRRTLAVFPLLVLWANVHGSVVLGAALVSWAGVLGLVERVRRRAGAPTTARTLVLLLAPWACLFVSPYWYHLAGYYRLLLVDSPVSKVINEWQAPTPEGYLRVFFVVAAAVVVLVVWQRRRFDVYDLGALALLLAGALRSGRGIVWFSLGVAMLVPLALDGVLRERDPAVHRRIGLALSGTAAAGLLAAVLVFGPRDDDWYSKVWSSETARVVAGAARDVQRPGAVYPTVDQGDWLLWSAPELRGRVAYDVRFEFFTVPELRAIGRFETTKPGWERVARGYPVVLVDVPGHAAQLVRRGGRVVHKDDGLAVVVRPEG